MNAGEGAFYTLDRELRLVTASARTYALWGKSAREVVGRKLTDIFPFVEGGPVHRALIEAVHSFRPVRLVADSRFFATPVDVEIYPTRDQVQVRFVPVREGAAPAPGPDDPPV